MRSEAETVKRAGALDSELREQEKRIRRFIAESPWEAPADDGEFGELALRSFRLQCDAIAAYGAYARHVASDARAVRHWRDIAPIPSSAFKSGDLSAAGSAAHEAGVTFETSGTTISRPGRIRLGSTRLYETSLLRNFGAHLLPDGARLHAVVFGPNRAEAQHSSLWFMADRVVAEFCAGGDWIVDHGEPRWDRADAALGRACAEGRALILLGTTLLFHAYFERCDRTGIRFALPPGSRAMDTGGAKGTRLALERADVEAAFERVVGIPPDHFVNEYGMAEMGSQFYDDSLRAAVEGRTPHRGKRIPPWVRTRVLDPETLHECADGDPGLLVHYDLANLEIPLAIQTEDVGVRIGNRIEIEGRLPEAERRGCSLPYERFVERERERVGDA